jgi:hypothetical protein
MDKKSTEYSIVNLRGQLAAAKEAADNALAEQRRVAELVEQLMARGTHDDIPKMVVEPEIDPFETALRGGPISTRRLTRESGLAPDEVQRRLSLAVEANIVKNAGSEVEPGWLWVIGDNTSVRELYEVTYKLISYRPMTLNELSYYTGARVGRLSGAIVRLQQDTRSKIHNLGSPRAARWFLLPSDLRLARIKTPR